MKTQNQKRGGFTLTELLVVIIIISILAALSFAGLAVVRKQSNIDQTQRTIQKIHLLLMEKLDEYQTKRIENLDSFAKTIQQPGESPQRALARARVSALRDLMRMEMPDRYNDIDEGHPNDSPAMRPSLTTINPPAALRSYFRKYKSARDKYDKDIVDKNAPAELLYMIVMNMPNAAEQFAEHEIDDVDGDGLKEFVDAWENPIRFIRWPAGFVEEHDAMTDLQKTNQLDPFDPQHLLPGDYALIPLVYSAGPDKIYDINRGVRDVSGNITEFKYFLDGFGNLHTCVKDLHTTPNLIGKPLDGNASDGSPKNGVLDHTDNITNHMMDYGKTFD